MRRVVPTHVCRGDTVLILVTSRTALSHHVPDIAEQRHPIEYNEFGRGDRTFVYHCKEHLPTWDWTPEYRRMVVQLVQQLGRDPVGD